MNASTITACELARTTAAELDRAIQTVSRVTLFDESEPEHAEALREAAAAEAQLPQLREAARLALDAAADAVEVDLSAASLAQRDAKNARDAALHGTPEWRAAVDVLSQLAEPMRAVTQRRIERAARRSQRLDRARDRLDR